MVFKQLSLVNKILFLQLQAIIFVCCFFVLTDSWSSALNPLLGGGAAFLPNVYFALRISRAQGQTPKQIVNAFYAGESGKLLLTVALFIMIFQLPTVKLLPLLTGYVAVLSIFWVALLLRD